MRKIFLLSLLGFNLLWAEALSTNEVESFLPWLLGSLLIIVFFFWSMYKALKTKNPKYGYLILLSLLIMVGILFL